MTDAVRDFAIVGGGPAGLHAALKAALLRRTAVLFDKGRRTNRIFFAKQVDNIPGFPEGIDGDELLDRQRKHLDWVRSELGDGLVELRDQVEVREVRRDDDLYIVEGEGPDGSVEARARCLVLATGVVDRQPWIGDVGDIRPIFPYANQSIVEYCLLCDGHKVAGKEVAVIGIDRSALGIAETLRDDFGAREVVLVTCIACALEDPDHGDPEHRALLERAAEKELTVLDKTIESLSGHRESKLTLEFADGTSRTFDGGFVSLGWQKVNNELAVALGAQTDDTGYVETTGDCEVLGGSGDPVPGLYCIGDLRAEVWNQIPIHFGDAETAVIHGYVHRLG